MHQLHIYLYYDEQREATEPIKQTARAASFRTIFARVWYGASRRDAEPEKPRSQ